MKRVLFIFISAFILNSPPSWAWNLKDLFSGMKGNFTPPGNYQDQAAGFYSGGGYSMRTKSRHFQPFTLTPPSLKTGCGGIDIFLGSLSMISGSQIVEMAKGIGTQAAAYGFHLALKTFAPQIEVLLAKLRDFAEKVGEFSAGDCQTAQALFESVLPKDSAMYEHVCNDLLRNSGGKDYLKSRERCSNNKQAREKAKEIQTKSKETVLLDNYNLFIVAAKKAKIPENMRAATMSIAGTLVVREGKRYFYESLVQNEEVLNAHLKGGIHSQYACDSDNCLNPKKKDGKNISVEKSYQGKANAKIKALLDKMRGNKGFRKADKEFLSSIGDQFPIYNYLSLERVSGISILDKSSDLIATHLLLHYMNQVIAEVKEAIHTLEGEQINGDPLKDYLRRLDRVQDLLQTKQGSLFERSKVTEKKALQIEKYHMGKTR